MDYHSACVQNKTYMRTLPNISSFNGELNEVSNLYDLYRKAFIINSGLYCLVIFAIHFQGVRN